MSPRNGGVQFLSNRADLSEVVRIRGGGLGVRAQLRGDRVPVGEQYRLTDGFGATSSVSGEEFESPVRLVVGTNCDRRHKTKCSIIIYRDCAIGVRSWTW